MDFTLHICICTIISFLAIWAHYLQLLYIPPLTSDKKATLSTPWRNYINITEPTQRVIHVLGLLECVWLVFSSHKVWCCVWRDPTPPQPPSASSVFCSTKKNVVFEPTFIMGISNLSIYEAIAMVRYIIWPKLAFLYFLFLGVWVVIRLCLCLSNIWRNRQHLRWWDGMGWDGWQNQVLFD